MSAGDRDTDTSLINSWRSIVTLLVFVLTNVVVLFPFHISIYIPRLFLDVVLVALSYLRVILPRHDRTHHGSQGTTHGNGDNGEVKRFWVPLRLPMNFVTAPLIADLFLLAIRAIGRKEVHDGTIGTEGISPLDIMAFFITLAYIAISIDASGLIRYLAFKVLQKGGKFGRRLFLYLCIFFFSLGSFIGNDPIILSGTAFLAYMTRVSSNIIHPRAWIYSQFAVANIASAILVSSNPTNLVLAGAFNIKFIDYTANMIVPVIITAIVLFPVLLFIVFADESLIPRVIKMHELSDEAKAKEPVNPNIPHGRGNDAELEKEMANNEQGKLLSLEEIMNPFLDKGGAIFGAVIMAATLITLLALNAASQATGEHPVFYVTLPAAFVMFCWDVAFGWHNRRKTRGIARKGRQEVENARAERAMREEEQAKRAALEQVKAYDPDLMRTHSPKIPSPNQDGTNGGHDNSLELFVVNANEGIPSSGEVEEKQRMSYGQETDVESPQERPRATLVSLFADAYRWSQETFPTVTAVVAHLPFALVPFAFAMFVLVQALVTKGWVPVFAYGWDHWVTKTGTIGAVGGMGFLSVVLCNFAGTNIGTTILLCRVIQAWTDIHAENQIPISDRTFWATVYGMALGVNYGAFSAAFSASLAGLLWRDILSRKHIHVKRLDFVRVNLPIIAIAMTVGCAALVGEVYIIRDNSPFHL